MRLRTHFIAVGLVCIWAASLLVALLLPRSKSIGDQNLLIEPVVADIGDLGQNQVAKISVTLRNTSSSDLTIASTYAGCSCTNVEVSERKITPSSTASCEITYEAGMAKGEHYTDGRVFYFVGKEKQPRSCSFSVRANVLPYVDFQPTTLDFDAHSDGREMIAIIPGLDANAKVQSVESNHPAFRATLVEAANSARSNARQQIAVDFLSDKWTGLSKRGELIVHTTCPQTPACRIRINVLPH